VPSQQAFLGLNDLPLEQRTWSVRMKHLLSRLVREDKGQDVIEYALLAAAISVVAIPTVPSIGSAVNNAYVNVNAQVGTLPGNGGGS
jgi:pilus assembly protein Flp/PilA